MSPSIFNKKLLIFVGTLLILGIITVFYFSIQNIYKPNLTIEQQDRIQSQLTKLNEQIIQNPKNSFTYLDKASALRQLGREDEALTTIEQAYAIESSWRGVADFRIEEARIWGQKNIREGILRYEALFNSLPASETLYAEYITFLKNNEQPKEKIREVYEEAIRGFPNSYLKVDYEYYLRDNPDLVNE